MEGGKLNRFVKVIENGRRWTFSVTSDGKTTECEIPKFVANIIMNYLNKGEPAEIDRQPMLQFAQP